MLPAPTAKKILVIDEDDTALFLAQTAIKCITKQAQVQVISDREKALQLIRPTGSPKQCFELIFLAVDQDLAESIAYIERLHLFVALNSLPVQVILVSSDSYHLDIIQALCYPVVDYITKPLLPAKLVKYLT